MGWMDRRHTLGLLAGATGAGLVGCGGAGVAAVGAPEADVPDMDRVLTDLDGMMKALKSVPVKSVQPRLDGRAEPERRQAEALVRRTLRSLVLLGTFRDLPLEAQLHPGMQARLRASLPELEATLAQTQSALASFSEDDKRALGAVIKKDPDLVMRLLGDIDEEAAGAGIPLTQRLAMRRVAQHVSTRLKQSASLFVDESVNRTERLFSRAEAERHDNQVIAAKAVEEALWKHTAANADRRWEGTRMASLAPPADVYGALAGPIDPAEQMRRVGKTGRQWEIAGWTFFGLSFALNGAGVALMALFLAQGDGIGAAIAGGFPLTHGVVFLILGIAMVVAAYNKINAAKAAGAQF